MSQSLGEWTLPEEAAAILVALGAGLLIGVERERHMEDDRSAAAAGIRTHAITALHRRMQLRHSEGVGT